jgi:hypothetical protein
MRPSRRCETVQVNGGRVRYARNGTVRLAYRVFGEAENTVVWTPGAARNVESFDDPASPFATLAKQLSLADTGTTSASRSATIRPASAIPARIRCKCRANSPLR